MANVVFTEPAEYDLLDIYVQPVIIHLIVTGSLHFELTELIVPDVPL